MTTTKKQRGLGADRPQVFGPYEVYEKLGVGGMATVHRAKERGIAGFERIVALKRLLPHLAEDESFVRAFVREAQLAALLNHVNIVQLIELGRVGYHYFISMEYIEGRDVRKILRRASRLGQPPPIDVTLSIAAQTCRALDHAHSRTDDDGAPLGLIHRDVSPSNLLVNSDGYIKVIDFGIAKAQTARLQTHTRAIKGKLAYLAPEAIREVELDARSDLFAVGVTVHELLTRRPLFASSSEYQTLQKMQTMEIAPPSAFNPSCPPELDAVVLKALERDRETRWQSARQMVAAIEEIARRYGLDIEPRTVRDWTSWAFSTERKVALQTSSDLGPQTPWPGSSGQVLEADTGVAEVTWEGLSAINAVLLDEVPDVSDRAFGPEAPGPAPSLPTARSSKPAGIWRVTLLLMLLSALMWATLIARAL